MNDFALVAQFDDHLGPLQRFDVVTSDPNILEVICQRVIEGESLRKIALAWKIPPTRFLAWIGENQERLQAYEGALKIRAICACVLFIIALATFCALNCVDTRC